MICFIVALRKEAESLISFIENKEEKIINTKPVITGKLFEKDVAIVISGIGKVSASLSTQFAIDCFKPSCIINFGSAGGTDNSVKVRSYYQIEKCCQFDFDLREFDKVPLGYIQEYGTVFFNADTLKVDTKLEKRNLATSDRVNDSKTDLQDILSLNCSIRDMEGGAISQVCTSNNTPLLIVKGITDVANSGSSSEQYYSNLTAVNQNFPEIIRKIFENI